MRIGRLCFYGIDDKTIARESYPTGEALAMVMQEKADSTMAKYYGYRCDRCGHYFERQLTDDRLEHCGITLRIVRIK